MSVQLGEVIAGTGNGDGAAAGADQRKAAIVDPFAPLRRGEQLAQMRMQRRRHQVGHGHAEQAARRAPGEHVHGARGIDDAGVGIEFKENIGPGEGEGDETVALLTQGVDRGRWSERLG